MPGVLQQQDVPADSRGMAQLSDPDRPVSTGGLVDEGKLVLFLKGEVVSRAPRCLSGWRKFFPRVGKNLHFHPFMVCPNGS